MKHQRKPVPFLLSNPSVIVPYHMTCFISKASLKLTQHYRIFLFECKIQHTKAMPSTTLLQITADNLSLRIILRNSPLPHPLQ